MADFYYSTLGAAWLAVTSYLGERITTLGDSFPTISFTWTASSGAVAGFWTLSGGSGAVDGNFYAGETVGAVAIPIGYVLRQPGFGVPVVFNAQNPGGIGFGITNVAFAVAFARYYCFTQVCGVTSLSYGTHTGTLPGMSGEVICSWDEMWGTATEVCVDIWTIVNEYYNAAPWGISKPYAPSYGSVIVSTQTNPAVVINESPPVDLDVSVNQGQAILSVLSRTTTMLP